MVVSHWLSFLCCVQSLTPPAKHLQAGSDGKCELRGADSLMTDEAASYFNVLPYVAACS